MALDKSTFNPLYKEHYSKTIVKSFHDSDEISPILACFESKRNPGEGAGRKYIQMNQYALGSTPTATFSVTQTKAQGTGAGSSTAQTRFEIDPVVIDEVRVVKRETIMAAEGDSDKMIDVLDNVKEAAVKAIRNKLGYQVCERGWGRVGTILAVNASPDYVDLDPSVMNRFEVGADFVAAEDEHTGALRSATARTVTSADSDTGRVGLSGSPVALSWDVGDTVFINGDRQNVASPVRLCITGLRAWLDHTTVSAVLHGVTRTGIEKLLGYKVDGTNLTHAQALLKAATKLHKFGGSPNTDVFVSDEDFFTLASDKDVQKNVEIKLGPYDIGFTGIAVMGPNGKPIRVVSDSNLEAGVAYMGNWKGEGERPFLFHNTPDVVALDDLDGNMMTRLASDTAYEMRYFFSGNSVIPNLHQFCTVYNLGATS